MIYLFVDTILVREPELGKQLSVPTRTLRKWRQDRIIPFLKVGAVVLYDPAMVRAALDKFARNTKAVTK
jgi:hypothetical protein